MLLYTCQKCGKPAHVLGDDVRCSDCWYIITKDAADKAELLDICETLNKFMDNDSKIWIAMREQDGANEWVNKLRLSITKSQLKG